MKIYSPLLAFSFAFLLLGCEQSDTSVIKEAYCEGFFVILKSAGKGSWSIITTCLNLYPLRTLPGFTPAILGEQVFYF